MRLAAFLLTVVVTSLAAADPDPPGKIVIRPKKPTGSAPASGGVVVNRGVDPARPNFWVYRPTGQPHPAGGAEMAAAPKGEGYGHLVIKPGAGMAKADAPPAEKPAPDKPVAGAKPAGPAADGSVVLETWDAAYLNGQRVGYFHVLVREFERDGKKYRYATKAQKITLSRFGQRIEQWAEDATMETPDGAVVVTRMRQGLGKDQKLSLTGTVTEKGLVVAIEGAPGGEQTIPWPTGVVGVAKEATLLQDRKPKAGDTFTYKIYEGRLNLAITITAAVKGVEDAPMVEGVKPRKLLKVVQVMDAVEGFQLPPVTVWCDPTTFEPVLTQGEVLQLGTLSAVRTTRQAAERPLGEVPEMAVMQTITLPRAAPGIHDAAAAVYRVTLTGDLPADKAFEQDTRQAIKNVDPATKSFDLVVTAVRSPMEAKPEPAPGDECSKPSFFIDWDDPLVKSATAAALGTVPANASAWDKAKAIERWVNQNMRQTEFSQAMATCANVARTRSGDCTEFGMLAAGMCRAAGIPSRTALGLVYFQGRDGKPILGYHLWTEVYADGRWLGIDAIMGRGGVGPGHLKITSATWHEEKTFKPLLPLLRVLSAGPKADVTAVTDARR